MSYQLDDRQCAATDARFPIPVESITINQVPFTAS